MVRTTPPSPAPLVLWEERKGGETYCTQERDGKLIMNQERGRYGTRARSDFFFFFLLFVLFFFLFSSSESLFPRPGSYNEARRCAFQRTLHRAQAAGRALARLNSISNATIKSEKTGGTNEEPSWKFTVQIYRTVRVDNYGSVVPMKRLLSRRNLARIACLAWH